MSVRSFALCGCVLAIFLPPPNALASGAPLESEEPSEALSRCLGAIRLPHAVLADGRRLPAAIYIVRLVNGGEAPPEGEQWIEFVRNGVVAARELAWLVRPADAAATLTGSGPMTDRSRIDAFNSGQMIRIWINWHGMNYVVHLNTVR